MDVQSLSGQIDKLFRERRDGWCEIIKKLLLSNRETVSKDKNLAIIVSLIPVYEQEKAMGQRTILEKAASIEDLIMRYMKLKFYLQRIDHDVIRDTMGEFYRFFSENQISSNELSAVINYNVIHKEKVLQIIQENI